METSIDPKGLGRTTGFGGLLAAHDAIKVISSRKLDRTRTEETLARSGGPMMLRLGATVWPWQTSSDRGRCITSLHCDFDHAFPFRSSVVS